ncbi:MAG: polymorphic toxin type 44 domain-containing protein [Alphaproteobacteria bacterium]
MIDELLESTLSSWGRVSSFYIQYILMTISRRFLVRKRINLTGFQILDVSKKRQRNNVSNGGLVVGIKDELSDWRRLELERKMLEEIENEKIGRALDKNYPNISPYKNQVLREFNSDAGRHVQDYTFKEMKNNLNTDTFKDLRRKANNWIPTDGVDKARKLFGDNKIWDHKKKIKEIITNGIKVGKNNEFPANFRTDKDTVHFVTKMSSDNAHVYDHDNWSNIHYGYIMKGAGFTKGEVKFGSRGNDKLKGRQGNEDIPAVEFGIDLYDKYGQEMTKEQFEDALKRRKNSLNRYRIR